MTRLSTPAVPPDIEPAPPRRVLRWTVFLALTASLWVLLFKGCAHFTVVDVEPTPEWTAQEPASPPEDFRFLAFPVSAGVDVYDAPGGLVVGKLSRAVGMSIEEERGDWVRVMGAGYVRRMDLTVAPPANSEQLIDAYEKAMAVELGMEFWWAGLKEGVGADGLSRMTFRESFDDYANISTYGVAGTTGVPLEFARDGIGNAFGSAFETGRRSLISMPITLVVGGLLTSVLKRRIVPRRKAIVPVGAA